ncbi:hypothetical protein ACCO45_001668 [Purpureocillium lilacinum]|uniref:Uncharacterized protein n=1 Tax=Purpureocillium lilacinum TaxID=33203 RepID=A0ACC4EA93_PURLI
MRMSTPVLVGLAQKAKREERHRSGIEMPHAQCAFLFGEPSGAMGSRRGKSDGTSPTHARRSWGGDWSG